MIYRNSLTFEIFVCGDAVIEHDNSDQLVAFVLGLFATAVVFSDPLIIFDLIKPLLNLLVSLHGFDLFIYRVQILQ